MEEKEDTLVRAELEAKCQKLLCSIENRVARILDDPKICGSIRDVLCAHAFHLISISSQHRSETL